MNNENLEKGAPHRFQPVQSGNPGGRPRNRPISERYAEVMERELPEDDRIELGLPEGATFGDAVVMVTVRNAIFAGKADAAREIREAIEGKTGPRQEDVKRDGFKVDVQFEKPPASETERARFASGETA